MELAPEGAPSDKGAATPVTAYQEYLKGRYFWNNWLRPDDDGLERSLSHYTEALRIDPGFAPAHAGAARAHVARALNYRERPRGILEIARAAAKRSLELDPRLSEGRLALADVRRMLEWDWRGAEAGYTDAIALNPSQENAHRGYATMLAALGRHADAVREADRAVELDPLCLVVSTTAAHVRYLAGDYDGALAYCRRTTDIDPQYLPARRLVGVVYLQTGQVENAVAVLDAAHAEARHDPVFVGSLVTARAAAGDAAGAAELLASLRRLAVTRYVSRYHLALAHAGAGDADAAFAALEQAVVDSDPALVYLAAEPRLEPLRGEARYARLLDLLGLS
jgi:tetratricopeptide (TPR) repeat protein